MKSKTILRHTWPLLLLFAIMLTACGAAEDGAADTIKYEGQKYVLVGYPEDVFSYDYSGNSHDDFEEADGIYPIDSPNWGMICSSKEATKPSYGTRSRKKAFVICIICLSG